MENTPVEYNSEQLTALSYDDNIAYEEQLPTEAERAASLAGRIGTSKVYLLSDSSAVSRPGKRKHDDDDDDEMMEDEDVDGDLVYRRNAILVTGTPISHLTTTRIFAYATHFDTHPLGLEWVNDNTCVLVFESNKNARAAFTLLQKSASELPDMDEFVPARPFPVALWPPEERINQTLGQGQGLKGSLRMRWAKIDDVKKKGAMMESKFYQKHGISAGKELYDGRDLPPAKRRRGVYEDEELQKARLDKELDQFLAEDDEDETKEDLLASKDEESDVPASPPSRMRSDYIAADGRTLLERTSVLRLHSMVDDTPDLSSRLDTHSSRRSRGNRRAREKPYDGKTDLSDRLQAPFSERLDWGPSTGSREPSRRGRSGRNRHRESSLNGTDIDSEGRRRSERPRRPNERPKKTQQELDDELDAFLRQD